MRKIECSYCDRRYPLDTTQSVCTGCGAPLLDKIVDSPSNPLSGITESFFKGFIGAEELREGEYLDAGKYLDHRQAVWEKPREIVHSFALAESAAQAIKEYERKISNPHIYDFARIMEDDDKFLDWSTKDTVFLILSACGVALLVILGFDFLIGLF